jgi:hypothetical protein
MLPVTVYDVAGVSNISDGFGLMLQVPFSGPTSLHLTGEPAVGDDMINGYVSTVTIGLPFLKPFRVAGAATKGGSILLTKGELLRLQNAATRINKPIHVVVLRFTGMHKNFQKAFFVDIINLIQQSKPVNEDIELAIVESKLRPTYTPCIMLKKGVANHNLQKLINLPDNELQKVFILLLSLFKIAYRRRFKEEKNNPDKWWYWDLSDKEKINTLNPQEKN